MKKLETSDKYSVNLRDAVLGAGLASLMAVWATLAQMAENIFDYLVFDSSINFTRVDMFLTLKTALGVFFVYLARNYFRDKQTIIKDEK